MDDMFEWLFDHQLVNPEPICDLLVEIANSYGTFDQKLTSATSRVSAYCAKNLAMLGEDPEELNPKALRDFCTICLISTFVGQKILSYLNCREMREDSLALAARIMSSSIDELRALLEAHPPEDWQDGVPKIDEIVDIMRMLAADAQQG